jgi:hypothetical protein
MVRVSSLLALCYRVLGAEARLRVACAVSAAFAVACEPVEVQAFREPPSDACPGDAAKTQPGGCGCGIPDDDADGDGALDCNELCPDNAAQTEPVGPCGCSGSTDLDACTQLRATLRNLYDFDGTGMQIRDSLGGMHGTLQHALDETPVADLQQQQLNGRLNLDGFGSYVDLPDGMISSLVSATFEVWLVWRGGSVWPRIFDFGNGENDAAEHTYIFLTPSNGTTRTMRAAFSLDGDAAETRADADVPLPAPARSIGAGPEHVALVVDATAQSMRLYLDGAEVSSATMGGGLSQIEDTNNWIGRSNYEIDPALFASFVEFRIYSSALTPAQINSSYLAGPGALDSAP